MTSSQVNAEVLLNLGFVDVGKWQLKDDFITYELDGENAISNRILLEAPNALYAFVREDRVLYIGKTARSIRKRYVGYCHPGGSQATNQRCHRNIKMAIADGGMVRIFVFTPITHLQYLDFEINLAAGLEDSLIREFDPPWNGKDKGRAISEDAEREEEQEAELDAPAIVEADLSSRTTDSILASFSVVLGPTYYKMGILNPGTDASKFLGKEGEPIQVKFSDGNPPVVSKINRRANRTGAVRVVGQNSQIARWFQTHFDEGDIVEGVVLDEYTIELLCN
ncbi:GIY-YIG nuclease family protein [Agrobacterium radiobacter]|uniref:GIY-YIG nuclease family protein n=1 Tax=Agrobacterium tumefaciens complex TaxID=1183400 RepID=UPI00076126D6|nr:GIY-YIG nuclease family protein [Agrobacterium tumefaciens]KWT86888.1 hypothetical protein ASB65_23370 [Agrobacterium tumefaciens str. B6]MQB26453.1 GIY-YIG nuclease family protein [Agrobacterium tumefaciens]NTA06418.1 GIY-YIG nuclease family protein [Agrobacterium tumefaciens]NTA92859.1 GIY-YIG nuclease family protein [Agrobacterium tumefaciens]NTB14065.1 GIY-YIG nuclease family protein [Agrobacterium tumefaciens]